MSIHRVFKPRLDVIRENQDGTLQIVENAVEQPRWLGRAETRTTRRRYTEPNMWRPCQERMPGLKQNQSPRNESGDPAPYASQRSYHLGQSQSIEAGIPRLSVQKEREYLARLRNAAEKPCISDSMSSVSMGYLSFKRALKNKHQMERLDCKFVDPRFRSIFLHTAKLSVIPEQMDWTAEMDDSVNPHLVKKDRLKNRSSNGRLPTPIRTNCTLSSLSSPMADLQMMRGNLLNPHLLCARSTDTLCSEIPANHRSGLKAERCKTSRASGNYTQECSGISERSEDGVLPARFNKKLRENLMPLSNNKNTVFRSRPSKLLRPLGTGCFSKSFQAVSQLEK